MSELCKFHQNYSRLSDFMARINELDEYMNIWSVAVLDSHPEHNKGPDHAQALVHRPIPHRSLILAVLQHTIATNPLIVRPLSGSSNCAW